MSETSVKDAARDVLSQFSTFAAGKYALAEPAKERFLLLCDLVERMDEEFGAENICVEVEPSEIHGVVSFDTDDIIFEHGQTHPFFRCIESADMIRFSKSEDGMLRIQFVVKDLWVKK